MHPKVLIVANDYTTIRHFRMELLNAMSSKGWHVIIALPGDDRNEFFEQTGADVVQIPLSRFGTNPFQDIKTIVAIKRILTRLKPDFVLTYTAKPNIYGGIAASLVGIPYAVTVTGLGINFDKGNLVSKVMLYLQRVAFKKAEKVFFQNTYNQKILQKHGIALNNSQMIPGSGVNLKLNQFTEYPDHKRVSFLSIARIRNDKGYDELFEVIKRCHDESVPAEFHVIGWYEDTRYQEIVSELKERYGVRFYEYVPHDEIHAYIADCDCLIQPSHHEGMSNVILEAAATGRPCIVSDIPGCREGVEDKHTGLLFNVRDADDLYEKVLSFIKMDFSSRRDMGVMARKLMEERFDRDFVNQQYMDLIEKACNSKTVI